MGPFPSPPGSQLRQPGRAIAGQVTGPAAIHQSNHQVFWSASSVNGRPTPPGEHGETPTSFSSLPGPTAIIYGSPCLAAGSRSRWGCWAATSVVSPGSRNKSNSSSVDFAFPSVNRLQVPGPSRWNHDPGAWKPPRTLSRCTHIRTRFIFAMTDPDYCLSV